VSFLYPFWSQGGGFMSDFGLKIGLEGEKEFKNALRDH